MINRIDGSINFSGLNVLGTVSEKNVEKLGKFASRTEIQGFIRDLKMSLDTDIVINGNIDQVSFSHPKYGDLSMYGSPVIKSEDIFFDISELLKQIKLSIKKAEKYFQKEHANIFKRGC